MEKIKNEDKKKEEQFRIETSVRLCNLRKKLGYNQEEFSKELGIPCSTYGKYEQCRTTIPQKVFWKLCEEYEFHTDASLSGENEEILPLYGGKSKDEIKRNKELKFRLTHIRAELKVIEKLLDE